MAIPTAGNAGGALAAYSARAGLDAWVFMPADTPIVNQAEASLYGARAYLDRRADRRLRRRGPGRNRGSMGWLDVSTLKEPYRIEGKKTMGLEVAEQFGWELPDVILYPTGGGTGLIGMWKAFGELGRAGLARVSDPAPDDLMPGRGLRAHQHRLGQWRAVRGAVPERHHRPPAASGYRSRWATS